MRRRLPTLAGLLLAASAIACTGARESATASADEPGRLVGFDEVLSTLHSRHGAERQARALRDGASWAQWWREVQGEERAVPAVDFDASLVLAVQGREGPTGCYRVRVTEVRTGVGGGYRVLVQRHVPRASTPCPMMIVHPAHAVRVPAVRGPIEFEWRTVTGPPARSEGGE